MSQELERVYTVPLGKVLLSPNTHRAVRAINMIKEFARHHMKTYSVKIDEEVSHIICPDFGQKTLIVIMPSMKIKKKYLFQIQTIKK